MKFNEMLNNIRAAEEAKKIKLEQEKPYNAVIKMVSESLNQKNKMVIQLTMLLTDEEVKDKKINKTFYVDPSYSETVRNIAYAELMRLLEMFEISIPNDIEEDDFITLLKKLKGKEVIITLKKTHDKLDPKKTFNNYTIYKNIEKYNEYLEWKNKK